MINKFRGILFSTYMVFAILEGRKNLTRRIIKYKKKSENTVVKFTSNTPKGHFSVIDIYDDKYVESFFKMPIQKGDILWVRETWQHTKTLNINPEDDNYGYVYKASENGEAFQNNIEGWKWKPSLFMPKEASRIHLLVTDVRIERLQDISEKDAKSEGVIQYRDDVFENYSNGTSFFKTAKESFKSLWEKINGKESWEENPFVWVYEFKIFKSTN